MRYRFDAAKIDKVFEYSQICEHFFSKANHKNKTHQFDIRQGQVGINIAKVQTFLETCYKNE